MLGPEGLSNVIHDTSFLFTATMFVYSYALYIDVYACPGSRSTEVELLIGERLGEGGRTRGIEGG